MAAKTKTLALVACASSKRAHPAPAADLYVSDLFRKARAYAEGNADDWFVLSAMHGLVAPGAVVEPYDLTLNTMGVAERRSWADRVWGRLEPLVESGDTVVFLAGMRYREGLIARLEACGVRVEVPMEGLGIGQQLAWLSGGARFSTTSETDPATIEAFYEALARLRERHGAGPLRTMAHRSDLPPRGVYFFVDPNEPRASQPGRARVVRVGTHALKRGGSATLTNRLRQHLGASNGVGNHRGSIFRLHVGAALVARDGLEVPTWSSTAWPNDAERGREVDLERRVSRYLGELEVLVVPILDDAGPDSLRGYVERNAIGLLSTVGREVDSPSDDWLGRHAARQPVRASGLWNVRHVGEGVDAEFVAQFAELVDGNGTVGRVVQPPASNARARVRALEGDAMDQHGRSHEGSETTPGGRPAAAAFRNVLAEVLENATKSGAAFVDVTSGDLHRRVGGYPGPLHAMPTCCSVMRSAMMPADIVMSAPPSGVGASLTIRYALPRQRVEATPIRFEEVVMPEADTPTTADDIRTFCIEHFVEPARSRGEHTVTLRAGDVHRQMDLTQRLPAVCAAFGRQPARLEFTRERGGAGVLPVADGAVGVLGVGGVEVAREDARRMR